MNLFGTDFLIYGGRLNTLPGEPFVITNRETTLTAMLADGSQLNLELGNGRFSEDTTLTVTELVLLGDVNRDGVVTFQDIPFFITVFSIGAYQAEADINEDGVVNFLDISPFVALLSS